MTRTGTMLSAAAAALLTGALVGAHSAPALAVAPEPPLEQALAQSSSCRVPATHDPAVIVTVHQVGVEMDVSDRVMLAGFEAGWVESHMHNLRCGDLDSLGVFQQRPSQGWGTPAQVRDVSFASRSFFREAVQQEAEHPHDSAGQIAQRVQRSAFPGRYDAVEGKARQLLALVTPVQVRAAAEATRYLTNDNRETGRLPSFPLGSVADQHVSGDWDGDGDDTPGYRHGQTFFWSDEPQGGDLHHVDVGRATDRVVVGDWDGDGRDGVGLVRGSAWFLLERPGGPVTSTFHYGFAGAAPVAGDWDGDGDDTPGVVRGNAWYLRDTASGGVANRTFRYGPATMTPVVGDWDRDGDDTPGAVARGTWYLVDSARGGDADRVYPFGHAGEAPLVGDWDRDGDDTIGVVRG